MGSSVLDALSTRFEGLRAGLAQLEFRGYVAAAPALCFFSTGERSGPAKSHRS